VGARLALKRLTTGALAQGFRKEVQLTATSLSRRPLGMARKQAMDETDVVGNEKTEPKT
jgi:hypothetical protein